MIPIIRLTKVGSEDLEKPKQESESAAGFDLRCDANYLDINPGEQKIIPTGFIWEIPQGYAGFIWPRSGLAAKHGIDVQAGLIDSDYRGEVKVILINHGKESVQISFADRIAQMVISPVLHSRTILIDNLTETERGEGGLGSTGKK